MVLPSYPYCADLEDIIWRVHTRVTTYISVLQNSCNPKAEGQGRVLSLARRRATASPIGLDVGQQGGRIKLSYQLLPAAVSVDDNS